MTIENNAAGVFIATPEAAPAPAPAEIERTDAVSSEGDVIDGAIVGAYDFYKYLKAFEGERIAWSIALLPKK